MFLVRVLVLVCGFTCAYGGMFAKTWRVHVIFTSKTSMKRVWSIVVDVPCPGPFLFLILLITSMNAVLLLTQMLVLLSSHVHDIAHSCTSFHFGTCAARLFCAFLVSVHVSAPFVITGSTQEVFSCLFRRWQDAFEEIPLFCVCRSACHDSSLYPFVLVLFLQVIVLSRIYNDLQHFLTAHCSPCLRIWPTFITCQPV